MTIDLLRLDEEALGRLYAERIEPILKANEAGRLTALDAYYRRRIWAVLGALVVCGAVLYLLNDVVASLIFAAAAFGAAHRYAMAPLHAVGKTAKRQSLVAIAQAIDCSYDLDGFEPDALARFNDIQLLPACDRSSFQDCFRGSHKGCVFAFYEGHLERRVKTKNGSRWDTVFRGQLVRIAFPKKFLGVTVVRRDAGIFNMLQRWTSSLQRVALGDSQLEKAFEVYSNDQVEARYLIHPLFMERLLHLETQFSGRQLRCAFEQGDLLIAIEGGGGLQWAATIWQPIQRMLALEATSGGSRAKEGGVPIAAGDGDKFEIGSMFSRLDDIGRARVIIADITELMRLIDAVLTAEQSPLAPS